MRSVGDAEFRKIRGVCKLQEWNNYSINYCSFAKFLYFNVF